MLGHYGETVGRLRAEQGLARSALARELGISSREVAQLEKSASRPCDGVLPALCERLGLTPDELDAAAGCLPPWVVEIVRRNPREFIEAVKALSPACAAPPKTACRPLSDPALATPFGSLYQMDCLEFLRNIEDSSVDLLFADPPFNLNKDYGGNVDDDVDDRHYLDWCVSWLTEAVRVLRLGGSLFVYNLPKWNLRLGAWLCERLEFRHWIAIDIKFSLPLPGRLYPSHYSLLYFSKGAKPNRFSPPRIPIETCRHCGGELRDYGGYKDRMNPAGVNITDVWTDLSPVRHSRFKRRKANELPLKLLDRVLDIASDEGDLVVDPFGGSGTTYVAAELKKRRWLGCEIGDCQPILSRFESLKEELAILQQVRSKVNVLFTEESLRLRSKFGHDTSRYRLANDSPHADTDRAHRQAVLFD